MLRALLLDLDGTLFTSQRRISEATLAVLARCRASGIRTFVATARPPLLTRMLTLSPAEAEAVSGDGIFYNGGCIIHGGCREYSAIAPGAVDCCLQVLSRWPEANYMLQMAGEAHACHRPIPGEELALWGVSSEDLVDVDAARNMSVVKFVIFHPVGALAAINGALAEALAGQVRTYLTGKPGGFQAVEVIGGEVSKKQAADRLLAWCGIDPGETAVFGDDANDAEILSGFANSVAMGNAPPAIQRLARHVTRTNDEDGVAYALTHLLRLG